VRALLQPVSGDLVGVDGQTVGKIGRGELVLLNGGHDDTAATADALLPISRPTCLASRTQTAVGGPVHQCGGGSNSCPWAKIAVRPPVQWPTAIV
jgi:hypothetical protein